MEIFGGDFFGQLSGGEIAVKTDDTLDRQVAARHVQRDGSAEAVANGGDAIVIDHRLLQ